MPDSEWDFDAIPIGDEVKSLTEWCRETGVPRRIAHQRITCLHWPPAQAVGLEDRVRDTWAVSSRFGGKRNVTLAWRGEEHTLKEWVAKIPGLKYRTVVDRFNRSNRDNLTPEDILYPGRLPRPTWSPEDIHTAEEEEA